LDWSSDSISTGYGDYERLRDIDTNPCNLAKRTHANIALLFNSGMQAISSLISYLEHRKHIQTLYDVQVYPEIAALIGGDGISIENAEFKAYYHGWQVERHGRYPSTHTRGWRTSYCR